MTVFSGATTSAADGILVVAAEALNSVDEQEEEDFNEAYVDAAVLWYWW